MYINNDEIGPSLFRKHGSNNHYCDTSLLKTIPDLLLKGLINGASRIIFLCFISTQVQKTVAQHGVKTLFIATDFDDLIADFTKQLEDVSIHFVSHKHFFCK